jgi:aspartyl-tRNA synthetase
MALKEPSSLASNIGKSITQIGAHWQVYRSKSLAIFSRKLPKASFTILILILKFLGEAVTQGIIDKVDAKTGDIIFFGADKIKIVNEALGNLREKI